MVPSGSWQVGSVPDSIVIGVGVPTAGVTFTVRVTTGDVPHPLAVTLMSTEPEKPLAHVITPVDGTMLPAAPLLSDQLNEVLLVAVVVYVVVVVPFVSWQTGSLPEAIVTGVGVPTVGVTVTVAVPEMLLAHVAPV